MPLPPCPRHLTSQWTWTVLSRSLSASSRSSTQCLGPAGQQQAAAEGRSLRSAPAAWAAARAVRPPGPGARWARVPGSWGRRRWWRHVGAAAAFRSGGKREEWRSWVGAALLERAGQGCLVQRAFVLSWLEQCYKLVARDWRQLVA